MSFGSGLVTHGMLDSHLETQNSCPAKWSTPTSHLVRLHLRLSLKSEAQALLLPGAVCFSSNAVCCDCPGNANIDGTHQLFMSCLCIQAGHFPDTERLTVSHNHQLKLSTDLRALETVTHLWLLPAVYHFYLSPHFCAHIHLRAHSPLCTYLHVHQAHMCNCICDFFQISSLSSSQGCVALRGIGK